MAGPVGNKTADNRYENEANVGAGVGVAILRHHPARFMLSVLIGEFDPGSERTLAARLTHASRTRKGFGPGTVAHG